MLSLVERNKYNQNISLNMLLDIADWGGARVLVYRLLETISRSLSYR